MEYFEIWLVTGISSLATYIITSTYKKHKALHERNKVEHNTLFKANRALLRDRLVQSYHYHHEKESISFAEKENWVKMFEAYRELGGNGVVMKLYEEMLELEVL